MKGPMLPQDIILAPVLTERSLAAIAHKKYTFRVPKSVGKIEIAKAVEVLFPGNKVKSVHTMIVPGKFRRTGIHTGYTSDWKKAIVTLTESSKGIEFFESMV